MNIGEDSFDPDALLGEPVASPMPEPHGGASLFVVKDLRVDKAGAVIDG